MTKQWYYYFVLQQSEWKFTYSFGLQLFWKWSLNIFNVHHFDKSIQIYNLSLSQKCFMPEELRNTLYECCPVALNTWHQVFCQKYEKYYTQCTEEHQIKDWGWIQRKSLANQNLSGMKYLYLVLTYIPYSESVLLGR